MHSITVEYFKLDSASMAMIRQLWSRSGSPEPEDMDIIYPVNMYTLCCSTRLLLIRNELKAAG